MGMEFDFKNQVLSRDLKEIISNIEILEISKGNVSGYSIEFYNKTTQSQGSYLYGKDKKHRDEDYDTLLEAIEYQLECVYEER